MLAKLGRVVACVTVLGSGACASTPKDSAEPAAHARELGWAPWAKATFDQAAKDDRIILVNVVATWCHWCHVMEETTYRDPEVVALLEQDFVTIRVDSDARPDVAERYREWGWPATGFLTPNAQPVLELRGYQNPRAFAKLLRELVADRDRGALVRREAPAPEPSAEDRELATIRADVVRRLDHFYEPKLGGWGTKQRYPFPQPVEHAFMRARVRGETQWRERALQTLASELEIVDPVWGGMYQYSVDGDWEHPHYEKITAIQAGAIQNYALAYRTTGDAKWRDAAWKTARYMTTMMRDEAGGFYTSQDADLRRPGAEPVLGETFYGKDDAGRRALGMPRIDTAVYADLNGLMIEALCELYAATREQEALDAAVKAGDALVATHRWEDGAFSHGPRAQTQGLLYLRDQAAMGRAVLALYRTTGDARWLAHAKVLGELIVTRLQDERGGFHAHTPDPDAVGVFAERRKPLEENGLTARFLLLLDRHLDGDGSKPTAYRAAALRALAALGDPKVIAAEGRIVGTYLLAIEEATMPTVDITVVGDLGDGGTTRALFEAALGFAEPRAILEVSAPGVRYPDIGKPAVYLCTETACSSPITKADRFAAMAEEFVTTSVTR
ncbi:MAG TPA: DUF255 domain-containing protein [Nannocystaceae bacterium]|nr:DUF255 domain-containing protein [Nannocystaceae bacterium]